MNAAKAVPGEENGHRTCRIRTTAPTQQREWALAGLGITRLPRFLVSQDLAAGRLVQVLPDHRYEAAYALRGLFPRGLQVPPG